MADEIKKGLQTLTKTVDKGFASVAGDIADVKKELSEFRAEMFEFKQETRDELAYIKSEIVDIRKRLSLLEEKVKGHSGFTKEIDEAFSRISIIEKHLGIKSKSK